MTFLNPALLIGLVAAGLPVIIHLLTRPKLRQIHWAAMKLLQNCLTRTRRRSRMEDLILLLLRCLLVALFVLLFARPAWLTHFTDTPSGEAVTAVILLDDSGSMQQTDGLRTRFDLARAKAVELLAGLGPDSACALYLVSDRARGIIPRPTQDLAAVRRVLDHAVASDRGSNLQTGVESSLNVLKSDRGRKREIFLITDSQMAAWRGLDKIRGLIEASRAQIGFHVFVIGDHGEDNLAVSDLRTVGPAATTSEPVRCAVTVSNWSAHPATHVHVTLAADGEAPQDEATLDAIGPGESSTLNLFVRFREPGYHSITATVPGDRLPPDNERSLALRVVGQMRALIVEGTPARGTISDGFFLAQALTPVTAEEVAKYYLKATTGPVAKLDQPLAPSWEVILLSNVARLSPAEAKNLRNYVENGGALLIFPGPATDPSFYDSDPDLGAILSMTLQPALDAPAGRNFLTWQSSGYQHPITELWNDPQAGTLASAHFTRYFPLVPSKTTTNAGAPQIVVNYSDGEPAVAACAAGKGRVVLFSSTATTEWNDLPLHRAFVPLLLRAVAFATAGRDARLNVPTGEAFSAAVGGENAGHDFYVERPSHPGERHLAGKIASAEQAALLQYRDTDLAGVYRFYTDASAQPLAVFAAQMDPAESNLQQQPAPDLAAFTAGLEPDASSAAPANTPHEAPPQWVPGREFWYELAVAALVLTLLELGLAHRFSQPK